MSAVLGIGCDSKAGAAEMEQLARAVVAEGGLAAADIAFIATLAGRDDLAAVRALSKSFHAPVKPFDTDALAREAPRIATPSDVARDALGIPSVAEAAALAGAGEGGTLLVTKRKSAHCTAALAISTSRSASHPRP